MRNDDFFWGYIVGMVIGVVFTIVVLLSATIANADTPDYTDDADERHPHFAGRLHIPDVGMDYAQGKYYLDPEDSQTYLCTRSGTLHYLPHELVGQYFEKAQ